jgi:hypothetical protein
VFSNKLPNTAKVIIYKPIIFDSSFKNGDDVTVTDDLTYEPMLIICCHNAL